MLTSQSTSSLLKGHFSSYATLTTPLGVGGSGLNLRARIRHYGVLEAKYRLGVETDLACDYWRWRHRVDAAQESRVITPRRAGKPALAVVIHAYYPELLPELLDRLRVIDVPFDLFVTNASGQELRVTADRAETVQVVEVENRGRDVWPFLQMVQQGQLDGYGAVLKLHTKKSPEFAAGPAFLAAGSADQWRDRLVGALLGTTARFHDCLRLLGRPDVGLVCHDASVLGANDWAHDRRATRHLARRLGIRFRAADLRFPAGSMYLCHESVVTRLRDLRMDRDDFEAEGDWSVTSTAHAVERLMGFVVKDVGRVIVGVPSSESMARTATPHTGTTP